MLRIEEIHIPIPNCSFVKGRIEILVEHHFLTRCKSEDRKKIGKPRSLEIYREYSDSWSVDKSDETRKSMTENVQSARCYKNDCAKGAT